ncbi:MAG: hypothetical protein FWC76_06075 [Defluviitaleaceae bacterium]|nr:hypothetical protein [Defluviitaleaceae bacterium]
MKKKLVIALIPPMILLILWAGPLVRFEMLTQRHGHEFTYLYKQTGMIPSPDFFTVLSHSGEETTIYYVTRNVVGNTISFVKQDGEWTMAGWDTIWSWSGSADGFLWPFWHHSIEGRVALFLLAIPLVGVYILYLSLVYKPRKSAQRAHSNYRH